MGPPQAGLCKNRGSQEVSEIMKSQTQGLAKSGNRKWGNGEMGKSENSEFGNPEMRRDTHRVLGVLHRGLEVLHRVPGVLHKVLGVLHRGLEVLHRELGEYYTGY